MSKKETVYKKDIVELVATYCPDATKKDIKAIVDGTFKAIAEEAKVGKKVQISDFGTFERKERPERVGRNPLTKEAITIEAFSSLGFKASKGLKDNYNEK